MARIKEIYCKSVDTLIDMYFPKASSQEKREQRQSDKALAETVGQEKASIKLRGKKQTNSVSLYIDQYKNGKHSYEYLRLYLNIESTPDIKSENRATMLVAEKILKERRDSLLLKGIGIVKPVANGKTKFIPFITSCAEAQLKRTGNKHSYYYVLMALAKHIEEFSGDVDFKSIDVKYVREFIEYLKSAKNNNFQRTQNKDKVQDIKLKPNHQLHLFRKFNYVLNEAAKQGYIQSNPCTKLDKSEKPQGESNTRQYLDVDEVKVLYKAECEYPEVKKAFLFCCFTGLRYSDVSKLTWGDFYIDKKGDLMLSINMKKVDKTLTIPINKEAQRWLGNKDENKTEDKVFSLSDNETTNNQLSRWLKDCGITKKITFHCSRHTAATLSLSMGCSIASVMTLLGHTKVATTMIYAKMLDDSMKQEISKVEGKFD